VAVADGDAAPAAAAGVDLVLTDINLVGMEKPFSVLDLIRMIGGLLAPLSERRAVG
jgi:hypothetical protein